MTVHEYTLEQRTFASGSVIPTAKESYADGFKNGFHWPDEWKHHPGGPYVYTTRSQLRGYTENANEKRDRIWAEASLQAHDEWKRGWTDGNRSKEEVRKSGVVMQAWASTEEFRKAV